MMHWLDYVIFVGFLLGSLGIGVYYRFTGGKQKTTAEFISANRKLQIIPTAVSLMVSYKSAISMIGHPLEVYTRGVEIWIGQMVAYIVCGVISERIIVPWLYPLKLTSVFSYFELRYKHRAIRLFASLLSMLGTILYMGVCMYVPAVALDAGANVPLVASIPIMATVCICYTALGGIKAVIWTDMFQYLLMMAGTLGILIKVMMDTGGVREVFRVAKEEDRLVWAKFDFDPRIRHTFWGFLLGYGPNYMVKLSLEQPGYQRYSAVDSQWKAKMTVYVALIANAIIHNLICLIGLGILAYFALQQCDVLGSGIAKSQTEILPQYVLQAFSNNPGFTGLFLSSVFSGTLSSISSSLSGAAANVWDDIVRPNLHTASEEMGSKINKITVVVFGVLSVGVAFLPAYVDVPISQLTLAFMAATGGPLLGLFLVSGMRSIKWLVNWRGCLAGGFCGLIFILWLSLGSSFNRHLHVKLHPVSMEKCYEFSNGTYTLPQNITSAAAQQPELSGLTNLYSISYLWYCPLGALITIIIAVSISLILYYGMGSRPDTDVPDVLFIRWHSAIECSTFVPVKDSAHSLNNNAHIADDNNPEIGYDEPDKDEDQSRL